MKDAVRAWHFADAAYQDNKVPLEAQRLTAGAESWGVGNEQVIRKGNIIAIRGSDDPQDWRRNFRFLPLPSGVHDGFSRSADKLCRSVREAVVGIMSDGRTPILTGHSGGAATAAELWCRFLEDGLLTDCYTFACPPVWTRECFGWISELWDGYAGVRHERYVCGLDIVPELELGIGEHLTVAVTLPAPAWTYWVLGWRRVRHHRRGSYRYGMRKRFRPLPPRLNRRRQLG